LENVTKPLHGGITFN